MPKADTNNTVEAPLEDAGGATTDVATPAEAPALEASPAAPVSSVEDPDAALAHAWAHSHLAGGPISRSTECWNALMAALPALAKMINSSRGT